MVLGIERLDALDVEILVVSRVSVCWCVECVLFLGVGGAAYR
jgi:hypothetical protein